MIIKLNTLVKISFAQICRINKKALNQVRFKAFQNIPGNALLSHKVAQAVPSAQEDLTSLFGKGRGVTPLP
jgi:hypothetical protein